MDCSDVIHVYGAGEIVFFVLHVFCHITRGRIISVNTCTALLLPTFQATNDGTSLGLSRALSPTCPVTITVIQSALAPTLVSTSFFATELLPAGMLTSLTSNFCLSR